jgi:HlyD family secretion protein
MTTDVSIPVAERKNVLRIPNTALRFAPPDDAKFEQTPPAKLARNERMVYSPGSNSLTLKPVILKVGITDGIATEVLDGLKEGGLVITSSLTVAPTGFGNPPPPPPQAP